MPGVDTRKVEKGYKGNSKLKCPWCNTEGDTHGKNKVFDDKSPYFEKDEWGDISEKWDVYYCMVCGERLLYNGREYKIGTKKSKKFDMEAYDMKQLNNQINIIQKLEGEHIERYKNILKRSSNPKIHKSFIKQNVNILIEYHEKQLKELKEIKL